MSGRHYLPNTTEDRQAMLSAIGASSVEELFADIPTDVRLTRPLALPDGLSELEAAKLMQARADLNRHAGHMPCFLGAGAYDHFIPAIVPHLASRSEFYTAYTQYQPEISQGGLQALWEYQSYICELTGMDVANSSLYDGATALAEAMNLACGVTNRHKVLVSAGIHPFYRQVLATYAHDLGFTITEVPLVGGQTDKEALVAALDGETAVVMLQNPNFLGSIEELTDIATRVHKGGSLLALCVNPITLALLKSPRDHDADIVVGEGQPLGLGLNFGGPYLGFMAVREKLMRRMPGRIVGQTTDLDGKRSFVLTLQAREQHIRREKAYSNICSNEGLCAVTAAIYLSAMGKEGLRQVATMCVQKAHYAAESISAIPGYRLAYQAPFFLEFVVETPRPAAEINERLLEQGIIGGFDLGKVDAKYKNQLLVCVTEKRTKMEIDALVAALEGMR